jgi:hypothetical protein
MDLPPSLGFGPSSCTFEESNGAGRDPAAAHARQLKGLGLCGEDSSRLVLVRDPKPRVSIVLDGTDVLFLHHFPVRQPPGIPGYFRHLPAGLIFSPNSDPDPDLLS